MERQGYRETLSMLQDLFPGRITISVDETAKAMNADRKTVYNAIKRRYNPLPSQKISKKKIVISVPALARWLCA